jgi:hypothetical protein
MKIVLKNILLISSLIMLANCDEADITSRPYPRIKTLPVTNISEEGVTFNAELISAEDFEVIEYGFIWGNQEELTISNSEVQSFFEVPTPSNFSFQLNTALDLNSVNYVRAYARTSEYIVYGVNEEF